MGRGGKAISKMKWKISYTHHLKWPKELYMSKMQRQKITEQIFKKVVVVVDTNSKTFYREKKIKPKKERIKEKELSEKRTYVHAHTHIDMHHQITKTKQKMYKGEKYMELHN